MTGIWLPSTSGGSASVTVRKNSGADIGSRGRLNLIEGAGVTLTVADDSTDDEIDITIAASASGTPAFVGAKVGKSASQSLTTGTWTPLTWDTEDFDTSGIHDTATNTSRLTIPAGMGGKWLVGASATFESLDDTAFYSIRFTVNGTSAGTAALAYVGKGASFPTIHAAELVEVTAGDYIEVEARHAHGSARNVTPNSMLWCEYRGA